MSENQYYLQPHELVKYFAGLCLGLEEHLLNPELRESATVSGEARCLSCCSAPALPVPGLTTHRVTALPGTNLVSPGLVSNISDPWTCLGSTVLLKGLSLSQWAGQPWQLCVCQELRAAEAWTQCHCHQLSLVVGPAAATRQLSTVVVSPPHYQAHLSFFKSFY